MPVAISKAEWDKPPSWRKSVVYGQCYVLRLNENGGTVLEPVKVYAQDSKEAHP
jgi:hypothetical protein